MARDNDDDDVNAHAGDQDLSFSDEFLAKDKIVQIPIQTSDMFFHVFQIALGFKHI